MKTQKYMKAFSLSNSIIMNTLYFVWDNISLKSAQQIYKNLSVRI